MRTYHEVKSVHCGPSGLSTPGFQFSCVLYHGKQARASPKALVGDILIPKGARQPGMTYTHSTGREVYHLVPGTTCTVRPHRDLRCSTGVRR